MKKRIKAAELKGKVDFGIIAVREDEFEAVLNRLPTEQIATGHQTYAISRLRTINEDQYVIASVRCSEQGTKHGQTVAHLLIEDLDPRWIILVGIAGSVPDYEYTLGDVVIASRLHDFSISASLEDSSGRSHQEFSAGGGPMHPAVQGLVAALPALNPFFEKWNTPEAIIVSRPAVRLRVENFYGDQRWKDKVRECLQRYFGRNPVRIHPKVFAGAIASSDILVKDTKLAKQWLSTARQIKAVEMELAGVYQAAWPFQKPVLAIRGISDVVGFKRSPNWTDYACNTAAALMLALLRYRPISPLIEQNLTESTLNLSSKSQIRRTRINASNKLLPRVFGSIPTDISHFTGRTTLLRTLSKFLKAEGSGVCTLLGLGGCGKSALLKKFAQNESLFSPPNRNSPQDGLFSWSFSQDDNLDHFYAELQHYIAPLSSVYNLRKESNSRSNPLVLPDIIMHSGKKVVLFLDGLERVIDERYTDNSRAGSVSTPALKALLQRASENECGSLRIFITTRIPIPEISISASQSLLTLDLNRMGEEDAIALLERSGGRGERKQLRLGVREFKFHAYSITLLGKALAEQYRGDIRRRDRVIAEGSEGEAPISQLLAWYLHHLDKYSICLLKAISIFRGSVSDSDINPFLSVVAKKEGYVGVNWTVRRVREVTSRLSKLGLIFISDAPLPAEEVKLDLHPIIREFFYDLLLEPADLHEKAFESLAVRAPEHPPTDAESITVLVEMIYHAVRSRHYELAWTIYLERLGGYKNIGYHRAEHPLGSQIIYTFLDDFSFSTAEISDHIRNNLFMDGALYLKNDGRLDDAIDLLSAVHPTPAVNTTWPDQFASILLVKGGIEIIRGRISAAKRSINTAQKEFERVRGLLSSRSSNRVEKECLSRLATVLAISAEPDAFKLFEDASQIPDQPDTVPHDHLPIGYGWYLMLRGDYVRAREVLQAGLESPVRLGARMLVYRVQSMMALNEAAAGNVEVSEAILHEISAWTLKPDLHVFILTWLIRAKIALARKDYVRARALAVNGLKYAGDNGYALEWIDLALTMAEAAVFTKRYDEALKAALLVLKGDKTSYSYQIPGASDKSVNYVWASLPANYIEALSRRRSSRRSTNTEVDASVIALSQLGHPFLKKLAALNTR